MSTNAYCVEKGDLHFSYFLKGGLLGRYLVITPKKSKLKILIEILAYPKRRFSRNYRSKRQAGRVLAKSLESTPCSRLMIPISFFPGSYLQGLGPWIPEDVVIEY